MINTKMKLKKTGEIVELIGVDVATKQALVWSNSTANAQNGNGWRYINLKNLRPLSYVTSATQHNEHKVKLIDAVFECSDGTRFANTPYMSVEVAKMHAQEYEYDLSHNFETSAE